MAHYTCHYTWNTLYTIEYCMYVIHIVCMTEKNSVEFFQKIGDKKKKENVGKNNL